jgi:hypothetical protein
MKGNQGRVIDAATGVRLGLVIATLAVANIGRADWPNQNPTKWVQYPEITNGLDVLATAPKMLADDFLCTNSGQITDIHIWGSWWQDRPTNAVFQISFWSDAPTNASNPYSHPNLPLWSTNLLPGQYAVSNWGETFGENFYDPNTGQMLGPDTQLYQYNFAIDDPSVAFFQVQSNVYWLGVTVLGLDTNNFLFGWKTSTDHWNDDAVFGDILPGDPWPTEWGELHYPPEGPSIDLAFALTTVPEPGSVIGVLAMGVTLWMVRRRRA